MKSLPWWAVNVITSVLIRGGWGRCGYRTGGRSHTGSDKLQGFGERITGRNAGGLQELEATRRGFVPRASGGSKALRTPRLQPWDTNFRLLAFRTVKNKFLLF